MAARRYPGREAGNYWDQEERRVINTSIRSFATAKTLSRPVWWKSPDSSHAG
jgi:hypothetical protein